MMNLYLRLLGLLFRLPFVPRRDLFAPSRVSFRVWPNDCDLNFHMNNGRYLAFIDLARLHFMAQAALFRPLVRHHWRPVLSALEINFIRSLKPLQKFDVVTRVLTWDGKYVYMEHRFEAGGVLYASATARGLFLHGGRTVTIAEVIRTLGLKLSPPPMPALVNHWKELTVLKKEHSMRNA
ncbi:MAG: thioesterase family protein [Sulfurifustaceae bacterium]